MVVLGYDSTLPVTMEDMIITPSSLPGCKTGDGSWRYAFHVLSGSVKMPSGMPVVSCRKPAHGGETGGGREVAEVTRRIARPAFPSWPPRIDAQSVHQLGGYKVQAKAMQQRKGS